MHLLDRLIARLLPAVPRPIVRRFSRRYIAGSSIDDAMRVVAGLEREGALATVDILGEFIHTPDEARSNLAEHESLLARIRHEGLRGTNISVKLTALGLSIDPDLCLANMRHLLAAATEQDNFVRIDMEDSSCTTPTLEIYSRLRREFPGRVGAVVQARLRRTWSDVSRLLAEASNFRVCKGIYNEPRSIAYDDPEIIRRNFVWIVEQILERGGYVGIATHDERVVWESVRLIRRFGLPVGAYEFQMLLGVDELLRRRLIEDGHRLRVYVPYGEQWYAYSVRRLRENPRIAGYVLRGLFERRA